MSIVTRFDEVDWRQSWIELQENRGHADDPAKWDARAASFSARTVSNYSRDFLKYLDLQPGETVLDRWQRLATMSWRPIFPRDCLAT